MDTNCFPVCWKEANANPLFKKGDTNSSNNSRPVSLLSCLGKLMERVMIKYIILSCMSGIFSININRSFNQVTRPFIKSLKYTTTSAKL